MYFSGFVFFLGACSGPVQIEGSVKNIWGKPIKGALIQLEGGDENQTTNAQGTFSFNAKKGDMVFRAGSEGHIHDKIKITYDPSSEEPPKKVEFSLYPEPEGEGFFAVGSENYISLTGEPIVEKATQLTTMQGIYKIGQAKLSKDSQEFVFQTDLRREEILQLSLQLHKMKYIDQAQFIGLMGPEKIDVKLWQADESENFSLSGFPQDHVYKISFKEALEPGVYSFHSGGVLTNKNPLKKNYVPEKLRKAYPFEIK